MFSRFMPREGNFFELFNAHAEQIVLGGRALVALMGAIGTSHEAVAEHTKAIDEIETRADKITHDVIALIHTTFITPLDRDEIHQLISRMDDVLDIIQDVAETLALYDIRQVTPEARTLADLSLSCAERVKSAVGLLSNMDNGQAMLKTCQEIDQLESDADRVMRSGMSKLFRDEEDVRQVLKLKAVYELLETITDRCEDVANIIEGVVLENS
jgi:uncharacterized protein